MFRIVRNFTAAAMVVMALAPLGATDRLKPGNPEENLPRNIKRLTHFGERASWSPDGTKIAFMAKSFGDAFIVDVRTGRITLLTHYPNPGYLRVQYLPNGDFLLVGARKFDDVRKTRYTEQELWYLSAQGRGAPLPFGQKLTEGVAVSRSRMKIAFAMDARTHPDLIKSGAIIYIADVQIDGGQPKLINQREAVRLTQPDCVGGEPQDFINDDNELIFVCYRLQGRGLLADVKGVDLRTGAVTAYRKLENEYNEVEGVFPDGRYAMVESSRDQSTQSSATIDLWKLRLAPGSTDMVRLTRWGDYSGYKASNPVISPDGRTMAFQSGRSKDEAGVGYGIFVMKLR